MADLNVPMLNLSDISQQPENVANMGLTQAQTGLVGQQTQAASIQNQTAALRLGLFKRALNDFSGQMNGPVPDEGDQSGAAAPNSAGGSAPAAGGSAPNADASGEDGLPMDTAGIQASLRQHFFVNPQGTPQMQRNLQLAALSGDPGLLQYAKEQRDQFVGSQTAENQKNANTLYDLMSTVSNAPDGAALATLERVSPQAADAIRQKIGEGGDEDAAARKYAQTVAANAHQYTGRAVVFNKNGDGIPRDAITQMPVTGVPNQGPTPGQWLNLATAAMKPVTLQQGTATINEPAWKYAGAPNPATYMLQTAARLGMIAPGGAGSNLAIAQARQALAKAQGGQQPPAQAQGAAQPSAAPTQISSTDPVMHKALNDTEYRLQTPNYAPGEGATKAQTDQEAATVEAKTDLMKDSQTATVAASQAITYLNAAKTILQGKGTAPTVGIYGPIWHQVTRLFGGVNATNYQEVAKYLSNAALQNARALYGSRMTQTEVKLQLEQMNPHTSMTDQAISDLIDENIANSRYAIQTARRVPLYMRAGNDPQLYSEWNQQYWPEEDVVNGKPNPNAPKSPAAAQPNASGAKAPAQPAPVRITSPAQAAKLSKGTRFQTPDGRVLVRN